MIGLSWKKFTIGAFLVASVAIVFSLKNEESQKKRDHEEYIVSSSASVSTSPENKSNAQANVGGDTTLDRLAANQPDKMLSVYGTAKEEVLVKKWCIERAAICGLDQKNEKVYESYDTGTLETLANNGDVRAMLQLARRYAEEFIAKGDADKGLELRNELYFKAAVYGSTGALLQLGLAANTGSLKSSKKGRELALEPLAYYEVAAMRGDRLAKSRLSDLSIKENDLILNDADYAYIETRAEEIYQDLQRQRHDLGLGEFDNEIPEPVVRYFDRIQ